ncbi:MAG: uncharacterized protein JWR26_2746 [Pedosphaera sp.]|nr:uncharacterized protein [Pedosphaera sp.]
MQIEFKSTNPPIDTGVLETFQYKWGGSLPQCYRDFLLQHNGGRPAKSVFPIVGFSKGSFGSIQVFFGLNTVVETSDLNWAIENRIPPFPAGLLEIACTDGSDLVCIDTKSENVPVYFLDHRPSWGNGIWRPEALYFVAASFSEFLSKLEPKKKKQGQ